jgi:acyl-CoA thioesterase I
MGFFRHTRAATGAALLAATAGCAASSNPARPSEASAPPRIVALGDSLTSGHGIGEAHAWPAVAQRYLQREGLPHVMVNAGVSGDTSAGALRRLGPALAGDVHVLVVAIGANDGLRGVPVHEVKRNIGAVIAEARQRGITVLLCGMAAPPVHGFGYAIAFHNVFLELASEHDVPLVPFFISGVFGKRELLLPDLVHPNAAGARVIADTIWPRLRPLAARPAS